MEKLSALLNMILEQKQRYEKIEWIFQIEMQKFLGGNTGSLKQIPVSSGVKSNSSLLATLNSYLKDIRDISLVKSMDWYTDKEKRQFHLGQSVQNPSTQITKSGKPTHMRHKSNGITPVEYVREVRHIGKNGGMNYSVDFLKPNAGVTKYHAVTNQNSMHQLPTNTQKDDTSKNLNGSQKINEFRNSSPKTVNVNHHNLRCGAKDTKEYLSYQKKLKGVNVKEQFSYGIRSPNPSGGVKQMLRKSSNEIFSSANFQNPKNLNSTTAITSNVPKKTKKHAATSTSLGSLKMGSIIKNSATPGNRQNQLSMSPQNKMKVTADPNDIVKNQIMRNIQRLNHQKSTKDSHKLQPFNWTVKNGFSSVEPKN